MNLDNAHVVCRIPSEYLIIAHENLQLMNLEMPNNVMLPESSYTSINGEVPALARVACPVLFHGTMYLYGGVSENKQYAVFQDNKVNTEN